MHQHTQESKFVTWNYGRWYNLAHHQGEELPYLGTFRPDIATTDQQTSILTPEECIAWEAEHLPLPDQTLLETENYDVTDEEDADSDTTETNSEAEDPVNTLICFTPIPTTLSLNMASQTITAGTTSSMTGLSGGASAPVAQPPSPSQPMGTTPANTLLLLNTAR